MTDTQHVIHTVIGSSEEFAEMAGIVVFIYALLTYVRAELGEVSIRIDGR